MNTRPPSALSFATLVLYAVLPLILLAVAGLWLITSDPLRMFATSAPPVEELTFERVTLDADGIHIKLRAGGSEPMIIAQVMVDDAYWAFEQTPPGPLNRMASAQLDIFFPWVEGDAHLVKIVTNTGATFEQEIAVAVPILTSRTGSLRSQTIVGGFVGVLPIIVGMLFFPLMRRMALNGTQGIRFLMALTWGMLAFLLLDTFAAALKFANAASVAFQGTSMVLLVAATTALGLIAIGRRSGAPTGVALATFIAFGIGVHNFGEGLAISAALAAGSAGLGAFLVLGFAIHNVTEGIAIAAPLTRIKTPPLLIWFGLVLLAGTPAILGMWIGSYAIAPQWAALALAIGTGAILQVLYEVGSYTLRLEKGAGLALDRYAFWGFVFGAGFMYVTAMVIKI